MRKGPQPLSYYGFQRGIEAPIKKERNLIEEESAAEEKSEEQELDETEMLPPDAAGN